MLLAVPNASEGRDPQAIAAIGTAFGPGLVDVHSDPDHGRSVFTLHGEPGELAQALLSGAREAVERIDLTTHAGAHPHVGALDVAPVVYLDEAERGAACAEALLSADLIARELGVPVFLYGALAGWRTRAELRRGGPAELARRMRAGELTPDFGPPEPHPTAGATLVAAPPPLVAQVSCNVEDHHALPLAAVVEAVRRHAPVAEAELVGLAPASAFVGFPDDVPVRNRRTIEQALGA